MSHTVERNRQPSGQPTGGEFAEEARDSSEVALDGLSDAEYNAEGTYMFPPRPRSLGQHISFWESVPIPDDIMANVQAQYPINRQEQVTAACHAAVDDWKQSNPDPTGLGQPYIKDNDYHRVVQAWKNSVDAVWEATEDKEYSSRPGEIPTVEMRTVLRAHHMNQYAPEGLTNDEWLDLRAHHMPWGDGEASVEDIVKTFRLWEIDEATRTPRR